jgi:hypothetical protein
MPRLVRAIVYAVAGGIFCGAVVLFGFFGIAKVFNVSDSSGWGALVPMVYMPLAILIGGAYFGRRGWRAA